MTTLTKKTSAGKARIGSALPTMNTHLTFIGLLFGAPVAIQLLAMLGSAPDTGRMLLGAAIGGAAGILFLFCLRWGARKARIYSLRWDG